MSNILLIPHIEIQNANALSSPYTIGFPAMTAWLGAVHALQRKLNVAGYEDLIFSSAAVACHRFDLQTHKGQGDYIASIIGTGNPLVENKKRKQGEKWEDFVRPSFIEEARCHLTISLVIEYDGLGWVSPDDFILAIVQQLHTLKLASGDILGFSTPEMLTINEEKELSKLTCKLMPSHLLIERRELMQQAMAEAENPDAISALLDYLTVHHHSEETQNEHGNKQIEWIAKRKTTGWIVPIATGFHGISDLGKAQHQRDPDTPHRFAESIVTLGEFVMPYRIKKLADMLWHTHTDLENNLYLCQQNTHSH